MAGQRAAPGLGGGVRGAGGFAGIMRTPALGTRTLEKPNGWRPAIAQALAERADPPWPTLLVPAVRAAAAMDCLNVAVDHWTASDGHLRLDVVLDEAFAALAPR
ncbi:hypothetical protein [Streptomyces fulvoviolaceus]|uniref:acyl-CoA-like ligand-binding transcription factor n=1 Tax=Streptomyces fulvoviolaceus TaxID=285535 RepID=UPI001F38D6B6|nr:hypothetical protein [Streptomyces fulvoviolaceus]MCT9075207.1 hypothetical protein [Streptomyces fulvoviolaceus]